MTKTNQSRSSMVSEVDEHIIVWSTPQGLPRAHTSLLSLENLQENLRPQVLPHVVLGHLVVHVRSVGLQRTQLIWIVEDSHWSRLSRHCALVGWDHSVSTPALLCHKDTAQGTQTRGISCLSVILYGRRIGGFHAQEGLCFGALSCELRISTNESEPLCERGSCWNCELV